jgi:aminoglycoside N3'-acetyltransferase
MITRSILSRDPKALGLDKGALLKVHASLRKAGPIEGAA